MRLFGDIIQEYLFREPNNVVSNNGTRLIPEFFKDVNDAYNYLHYDKEKLLQHRMNLNCTNNQALKDSVLDYIKYWKSPCSKFKLINVLSDSPSNLCCSFVPCQKFDTIGDGIVQQTDADESSTYVTSVELPMDTQNINNSANVDSNETSTLQENLNYAGPINNNINMNFDSIWSI